MLLSTLARAKRNAPGLAQRRRRGRDRNGRKSSGVERILCKSIARGSSARLSSLSLFSFCSELSAQRSSHSRLSKENRFPPPATSRKTLGRLPPISLRHCIRARFAPRCTRLLTGNCGALRRSHPVAAGSLAPLILACWPLPALSTIHATANTSCRLENTITGNSPRSAPMLREMIMRLRRPFWSYTVPRTRRKRLRRCDGALTRALAYPTIRPGRSGGGATRSLCSRRREPCFRKLK